MADPYSGRTLVAVISDLHLGSTIGLCPPSLTLDDGGTYMASRAQRWLWLCWQNYWEQVRAARRPGDRLYVVVNGDIMDGDHHDTPQIITRNPSTILSLASSVLDPVAQEADRLFIVRGTETHVGKSASQEEEVARDLGAVPDAEAGTHSWWVLPMEVEGVNFQFAHHGNVGSRTWSRGGTVMANAADISLNHLLRGQKPPDVAVRSHMHQFADSGTTYPTRLFHTPAWQLSTAFVARIAPGKVADFGGFLFSVEDGEYEFKWIGRNQYIPKAKKSWKEAPVKRGRAS